LNFSIHSTTFELSHWMSETVSVKRMFLWEWLNSGFCVRGTNMWHPTIIYQREMPISSEWSWIDEEGIQKLWSREKLCSVNGVWIHIIAPTRAYLHCLLCAVGGGDNPHSIPSRRIDFAGCKRHRIIRVILGD
jgi:hypothetical protein